MNMKGDGDGCMRLPQQTRVQRRGVKKQHERKSSRFLSCSLGLARPGEPHNADATSLFAFVGDRSRKFLLGMDGNIIWSTEDVTGKTTLLTTNATLAS